MTTMTKASFTPGPWTVAAELLDENGANLIDDGYQKVTAGEGYLDNDEGGTGQGFQLTACMNRADANLIAAAPEMYEALKRARNAVNDLLNDGYTGYVDVAMQIAAALAKADGGQQ